MKSKILSLLLGCAALLNITACNLDEDPYGFYSEDNFYKTPQDAEAALMYAYNALTYIEYSRGIFYIGELASETCDVKAGEGFGSQELNNWTSDNNNETLSQYFKYCYIAINRANAVIENLANSSIDASIKDRVLGEAYFLRGYSYMNLVRVFGLVPIQRKMVKELADTYPLMAKDMDELYDFIISDFKIAEELLKVDKRVGRANQVAAQGFIAKAYLTIASSKESNVPKYKDMRRDVATMYDSAAFYSRKVIYDQSLYQLDDNLQSIYDVNKPDGSEHIFIMSLDRSGQNEGNYSKLGMMFHPWANGNSFYLKDNDGSLTYCSYGWEVFQTTSAFYNSFVNTDKRKTELMVAEYYDKDGNVAGKLGSTFSFAFTRKYVDPDFDGQKSSAKPYLLRFSDVALVYAEAVGATTEGYEWLNKIRSRAGLTGVRPGMNDTEFRDAVIQERAWEFAFEGQRLYDLRRKGMVTTKDPRAMASGISEEKAAFFPIPQTEVDLNPNVRP